MGCLGGSVKGITLYTRVSFFLCLLVVVGAIIGGVKFYSPVPFWDMWNGYLGFYTNVASGDHSIWWAQHNEHRIVLSRILFWMDIRWFGGLSYSLIVINYLLVVAACFVFFRFLSDSLSGVPKSENYRNFFISVIVAWLFAWCQYSNLSWGFQSQFFLAQLLPLCSFYFIYKASGEADCIGRYFLLAAFFGVLSIGTMANGVLALPLLVCYSAICRMGLRRALILLVLSVCCIGLYFKGYQAPEGHGSLSDALRNNPLGLVHYLLLYMGSPFYYIIPFFKGPVREMLAAFAGLFIIATSARYAFINVLRTPKNFLHVSLLFFILYIGGTALGTAGGRLIFGVEQALTSRYTTPALMAWVALLILGMPKMVGLASRKTAVLPVFLFLSASVLVAQKEALDDHLQDKFERMVAALALELRVHDQAQVAQVFPKVDWALSVARYPADNHLSIFGIRPIKGSREGIESVYPARSDTRCSGSLDEVSAIAGENQYASVRGWFFDGKSNQSSILLTIVDPQGLVVGYALTGAERPDVASLVDAKAGRSGFKGYVLKDRLGSALTLESADFGCHLEVKTTPIVYNYKVVEPALSEASVSINSIVDPQGWLGTDSWHSMIKGMTVVGSWRQSDADTGSITLRLKRGDKLLYRSGPTGGRQQLQVNDDIASLYSLPVSVEWGVLDFSSEKLPDLFNIKITDSGAGWGEWSAIALIKPN